MYKKIILTIIFTIAIGACSRYLTDPLYEDIKDNNEIIEEHNMNRYPAKNMDNWSAGQGWNLVWSDEFDNAELNEDNWSFQVEPPGRFNAEWQRYTDSEENCYIYFDNKRNNGYMVIEAKHNGNGLNWGNFSSARMITHGKQEFKYGKIAARIQVPYGQGIWPAFWMLGTNISENPGGTTPWPQSGEIDIMEKIGSGANERELHGTIHYWKDSEARYDYLGGSTKTTQNLSDNFHVYEIEWDENKIIWRLDGNEYHRQDIRHSDFDEFREKFYILLNVAVGGNWPGYPDNTTTFPQYMFVDWVRVYQREK